MEKINDNISFNVLNTIIFVMLSLLIISGIIGLLWTIVWNRDEFEEIVITSKKNITDQHFFGYFSLFVLFALSFDLTMMSMFFVSFFIILFLGIVYINNKIFYINPLLNILGYNFYEITYKIKGEEKEHTAKMFYRGTLELHEKIYRAKIKNENFTFIDKKNKNS